MADPKCSRRWLVPLFILAAASLIPACNALIAYSEPDSGPIARVRFVNDSTGVLSGFRQYDDDNCATGEREVARFSTRPLIDNHKSVGIPNDPDMPKGEKTEIRVRAGQPFYGVYWSSSTLPSRCRVAFEFLPEAGRDYQVTFHWDLYQPWCSATLTNVNPFIPPRNIGMPSGRCLGALTKQYLY
jgi:hypothetical protein